MTPATHVRESWERMGRSGRTMVLGQHKLRTQWVSVGEPRGEQEQSKDGLGPCCGTGHRAPWLSMLRDRKRVEHAPSTPLYVPSQR